MNLIHCLIAVALVFAASPVRAESDLPDLKGKWVCDPAPILIRGDWTTLTYVIDISEQRDALFKGTFHWTLPEKTDVKGEEVTGAKSFEGTWTALGVVDWDGTTVEVVSLKDVQRHVGTWKTPTRSASSTARSATTPGSAARPASGKGDRQTCSPATTAA